MAEVVLQAEEKEMERKELVPRRGSYHVAPCGL